MLPEIFGLIQCTIGCVIVFKHSQKVVWHRKWVLHPVVAPIRDQKTRKNAPKLIILGNCQRGYNSVIQILPEIYYLA